jgi:hypothetical protein
MLDRVLDDGLQQQRRHSGLERVERDVGVDGEAVLEPGLLDLQVGGEELQLLAERDDLMARLLQRVAADVPAARSGGRRCWGHRAPARRSC